MVLLAKLVFMEFVFMELAPSSFYAAVMPIL
jgi:hypothetical protein